MTEQDQPLNQSSAEREPPDPVLLGLKRIRRKIDEILAKLRAESNDQKW
ncbi:MAG: hypothetical protein JRN68_05085 [Nitrososphaerota archaeon]|jgi:hypothetical protein|nr:hypothetical protein [Nitrososphaerota archaeon]